MTMQTVRDEDFYTLLCVRADGVAPVVDLAPAESGAALRDRVAALFAEHASCDSVEVWLGASLVDRFSR